MTPSIRRPALALVLAIAAALFPFAAHAQTSESEIIYTRWDAITTGVATIAAGGQLVVEISSVIDIDADTSILGADSDKAILRLKLHPSGNSLTDQQATIMFLEAAAGTSTPTVALLHDDTTPAKTGIPIDEGDAIYRVLVPAPNTDASTNKNRFLSVLNKDESNSIEFSAGAVGILDDRAAARR